MTAAARKHDAWPTGDLPSTPAQRKALVLAGKKRSLSVDDLRAQTSAGSLHSLTRRQASDLLDRLNAPSPGIHAGGKRMRRLAKGAARMITEKQRNFITSLLARLEWDREHYGAWLKRSFGWNQNDINTTARGHKVIEGLKAIASRPRRERRGSETISTASVSERPISRANGVATCPPYP